MWKRRTFHQCAEELSTISEDFRSAYTDSSGWDQNRRNQIMADTSRRGVEVLRILALSIRSDQDFGLTTNDQTTVGVLKSNATQSEISSIISGYQPPYTQLSGYTSLGLRQALNKIAHANPTQSGFSANNTTHDLILSGENHHRKWIAIISLIDLCQVIKSLPDAQTQQ